MDTPTKWIRIPHGWEARPYQQNSWRAWEQGCKREILIWHRRAGKDDVQLHKTMCSAWQRVGNYWHALPQYSQARKAIWEAINPLTGQRRIDEAFPKELRETTLEHDMFIRLLNGSTFKLVGSDNPDALVGSPPIGITFSEFALSNPASWAYLAPILAQNGGWASFITTPRGRGNHAYRMLKMAREMPWSPATPDGWFSEVLTVDDTGFSPHLVETQRREYHGLYGEDAGDALIEQEYNCSFEAAVLGAYYAKAIAKAERAGRLGPLSADPALPLHSAWDLGKGANMAVWLYQVSGAELRVLAGIAGAHDEVIEDVVAKLEKWRGEHAPGCKWGIDYVPHDARVRELGSGRTRVETFIALKRKPALVPAHKVDDGISAARATIGNAWFDDEHCADALEALRLYRADYDEDLKVFRDIPLHDWTSHFSDAWRYLSMAWRQVRADPPKPKERRDLSELTLDDLWKMSEQSDRRIRI